ncbi:hypothetical protein M432DRAFT_638094 [Thermoascus aurantiacus ATCC 26904]
MKTSYAFNQHEQYEPLKYRGHQESIPSKDDVDEKFYVRDCLCLLIRAWLEQGERLPPTGKKFEFQAPLVRTVPSLGEDVVIWLELFASDSKTVMEDHFPKDHPQNQSSKSQGSIRFVITSEELQRLGLKPQRSSHRKNARKYYTIEYYPVITIEGQNIKYELWFQGNMRVDGQLEIAW